MKSGTVKAYLKSYCKPCEIKEKARRYKSPAKRDAYLKRNRNYALKKYYGISIDDYDVILARQAGRCAICGESAGRLHVDHDHQTGEIRGLLCARCNIGIGGLGDQIDLLECAVDYLKKCRGDYNAAVSSKTS